MADQTVTFNFKADNANVAKALTEVLALLDQTEQKTAKVTQAQDANGKSFVSVIAKSKKELQELNALIEKFKALPTASTGSLTSSINSIGNATVVARELQQTIQNVGNTTTEVGLKAVALGQKYTQAFEDSKNAAASQITSFSTTAEKIVQIERQKADQIAAINERVQQVIATNQQRYLANPGQVGIITGNTNASINSATSQIENAKRTATTLATLARQEEIDQQAHLARMVSNFQQSQQLLNVEALHGGASLQAIRLRYNQQEINEQTLLAEKLAAIRLRMSNGLITPIQAQHDYSAAIATTTTNLNTNRDSLNAQLNSLNANASSQRSLLELVTQYGIAWRIVNGVISEVISSIKAIPNSGIEMQSTISALHASFGTTPQGVSNTAQGEALTAIAMKNIQVEAQRTGIAIATLEQTYRTFLASAHMAGESTSTVNSIFSNLNTVITSLHMSGERANLTFLALSQMFNKGKVQSEELTKQLGNLLPGAFATFAAATGRTTEKLVADMKAGTVSAHENIAKFIEFYANQYGDAFEKASSGLNANLGRLQTAQTNFSRAIFLGTQEEMTSFVQLFTDLIEKVTPASHEIENFTTHVRALEVELGLIAGGGFVAWLVTSAAKLNPWVRVITGTTIAIQSFLSILDKWDQRFNSGIVPANLSNTDQMAKIQNDLQVMMERVNRAKAQNLIHGRPEDTTYVKELEQSLVSLAETYRQLGEIEQKNNDINDVQNEDLDKRSRLSEQVSASIYKETLAYNKQIDELQQLRQEQDLIDEKNKARLAQAASASLQKLPSSLTLLGQTLPNSSALPGSQIPDMYKQFVDLIPDVLDARKEEDTLNAATKNLMHKRWAEIDAETKKQQTEEKRALEIALSEKKEILNNNLDTLRNQAKEELDIFANKNSELELLYRTGTLSLYDYIQDKERAIANNVQTQLTLLDKEIETLQNYSNSLREGKALTISPTFDSTAAEGKLSKFQDIILAMGEKYKVNPLVIDAIIHTESTYDPNADANKNFANSHAHGLMQLQPATGSKYGLNYGKLSNSSFDNSFDPVANIEAGTHLLSDLMAKYHKYSNGLELAIRAYHDGEGKIDAALKSGGTLPKSSDGYYSTVIKNIKDINSLTQNTTAITANFDEARQSSSKEQLRIAGEILGKEREKQKVLQEGSKQEQEIKLELLEIVEKYNKVIETPDDVLKKQIEQIRNAERLGAVFKDTTAIIARLTAERDKAVAATDKQINSEEKLYNQILKGLQRDIRNAGKDDRGNYLDKIKEQLIAENKIVEANNAINSSLQQHVKTAEEIDTQVNKIKESYDLLQKEILDNALLTNIKQGVSTLITDLINGTKSVGEAFTSMFDSAVDKILSTSLKKLENALEKVFSEGGSWFDVITSAIQIGAVAIGKLLTRDNSTSPVNPATSNQNSQALEIASFYTADTNGRNAYTQLNTPAIKQWNDAIGVATAGLYLLGEKLVDFGATFLTSLVTQQAATSIASTVAEKIPYLGQSIAVLKFGYDLYSIAQEENIAVMIQVSQALNSASNAVLGVAAGLAVTGVGIIPAIIALAVAGALKVGSAATSTFENGFNQSNMSSLAGGILGDIAYGLFSNGPSATMLGFSNNKPDSGAHWTPDRSYFTSGDQTHMSQLGAVLAPATTMSASVGVETKLGSLSARINDVDASYELISSVVIESFFKLLTLQKTYNDALGNVIDKADIDANTPGKTLTEFNKIFETNQWEQEQNLNNLDTSSWIANLLSTYGDIFSQTTTLAGQVAGTWLTAFSNSVLDPSKGGKYNSLQAYNVQDLIINMFPDLLKIPLKLAELYTNNVKSIADGATGKEFLKQFTDFFDGWTIAEQGLANLGTDISNTLIPEYLTSLVGFGFTVKESAIQLVTYAKGLQVAGKYTNDILNNILSDLITTAKDNNFDKAQTAGFTSSAFLLGQTSLDLGYNSSPKEIKDLSLELVNLSKATTSSANAVIDRTIAEAKLTNISREAAIQQLVLVGTLTDSQIKSADFSIALISQTRTWTDALGLVSYFSNMTKINFADLGVSFGNLVHGATEFVTALGGIDKAFSRLQTTLKAAMGETNFLHQTAINDRSSVESLYSKYGVNDQTVGLAYQQALANTSLTSAQKAEIVAQGELILASKASTEAYNNNIGSLKEQLSLINVGDIDPLNSSSEAFLATVDSLATSFGSADAAANALSVTLAAIYSPGQLAGKTAQLQQLNFANISSGLGLTGLTTNDALSGIENVLEAYLVGKLETVKNDKGQDTVVYNGVNLTLANLLELGQAAGTATTAQQTYTSSLSDINGTVVESSKEVVDTFGSLTEAIDLFRGKLNSFLTPEQQSTKAYNEAKQDLTSNLNNPQIKDILKTLNIQAKSPEDLANFLHDYSLNTSTEKQNLDLAAAANIYASNPSLKALVTGIIDDALTVYTYTPPDIANNFANQLQEGLIQQQLEASKKAADAVKKITEQLSLIGKSDIAKSIASLRIEIQGLQDDLAGGNTSDLTKLSQVKFGEIVKPFITEMNNFGKSDIQIALEGVTTWAADMRAAAPDLAEGLHTSVNVINSYIDTISNQRTITALKSANNELVAFRTSMVDFSTSLKETRVGTPAQQFQVAQNDAIKIYQEALTGNKTAMGKVQNAASTYLDQIQQNYGNSDLGKFLSQQVIDAIDNLGNPDTITLEDYVQQGSIDIVKEIQSLPANLLAKGVLINTTGIDLSSSTSPVVTNTGSYLINSSTTEDNSAILNEIKSTNEELRYLREELKTLKKEMQKELQTQTNALINTDIEVTTQSTVALMDVIHDNTKAIAYKDKFGVKLL